MRHLADALMALLAVAACLGGVAFIGWLVKPLALMALGVLLTAA